MDSSYVVKMLESISDTMEEHKQELIDLDSVVGDGDLGLTMTKGFAAAFDNAKNSEETDIGKLLYAAGKAMSSAAPSTMGTLMSLGLMGAGKKLKGKAELAKEDIATLLNAYEEAIMAKGKAKLGEKTFLDGFDPGIKAYEVAIANGEGIGAATKKAAEAALEGFHAAKSLLAVHGKPAVKGEASKEMDDPGARVAALIMEAISKISEE